MKRITRLGSLAATVLMMMGAVLVVGQGAPEPAISPVFSLSDHDAIEIDGNAEFASMATGEDWAGSGIQTDPYIIEDLKVNAKFGQNGIRIENTDVNFVIINCTFTNVTKTLYGTDNGVVGAIFLNNCSNSVITNVTLDGNRYGIRLNQTKNVVIDEITHSDGYVFGVRIDNSGPDIIVENSAFYDVNNTIQVFNSHDVIIEDNNIQDPIIGILTEHSSEISISLNTIGGASYCGISLGICSYINISDNSMADCLQGLTAIILSDSNIRWNTLGDMSVPYQNSNGITISESIRVDINDNIFQSLNECLTLYYSLNCNIDQNSYYSSIYAFKGYNITDCEAIDSHIEDCTYGISLVMADRCNFEGWTILYAKEVGIYLEIVNGSEFKAMVLNGNSRYGILFTFSKGNVLDDVRILDASLGIYFYNSHDNDIWDCNIDTHADEGIYLFGSVGNRFVHNRINSADLYTAIRIARGSYSNEFYSNALYRGGLTIEPFYAHGGPFDLEIYTSQYVEISNTYEGRFILYLNGDDLDNQTLTTSYGQIFVIDSRDVKFRDQYIHGVEKGIEVISSSNVMFTSSRAAYNLAQNVRIYGSHNVVFSNLMSWGSMVGAYVETSSDIEFSGCGFWDEELGIQTWDVTDLTIYGSNFENITSTSNYCFSSSRINIEQSTFEGPGIGVEFWYSNRSSIKDCDLELVQRGIAIWNSDLMEVNNNNIMETPEEAISLLDVDGSKFLNNNINNSKHGITVESCNDIELGQNSISRTDIGIALTECLYANVSDNSLRYNNIGLNLYLTNFAEVRFNLFFRNTDYAIRSSGSDSDRFLTNTFIRNKGTDENYHSFRLQVYDESEYNTWFTAKELGNYYSDRFKPDNDNDGVVDSTYGIAGGTLVDRYPLVFSPVTIISNPREINTTMGLGFVYIDWEPPTYVLDGGIDGYLIYRGTDPDEMDLYYETMDAFSEFYDNYVDSGVLYYYMVRAYNELGYGEASDIISGYTDDSSPNLVIIEPLEEAWYNTRDVLLRWEAEDEDSSILRYMVKWDSGEWRDLTLETEFTIRGLSEGEHVAYVRVDNKVGLSTQKKVDFHVDITRPEIYFSSSDPVYTNGFIHTVVWTADDPGGEIESMRYKLNMGPKSTPVNETRVDVILKDGRNTFDLEVVDKAGNMASQRLTIYLDTDPPVLTGISPGNGTIVHLNDKTVNFQWTCVDAVSGVSHFKLFVNEVPFELIGTIRSWTLELEEGISLIQLDAWDNAGNVATLSWKIEMDLTAPRVLDYWPKGGNINVNTPIYVTFSEPMYKESVSFTVEGASGQLKWDDNRLSFTLLELLEYGRTYVVKVNGPDPAGNMMGQFSWQFSTYPSGTIKGRVIGANGNPIFNAIVTIDTGRYALTDNEGRFSIQVAPGQYTVTVEKDGYKTRTYEVNLYSGEVEDLGTIKIRKEGFYLSSTLLVAFSISAAVIVISLLIISGVIIYRRRSRKMEFFVVDGETMGDRPHLHVELEEDDDEDEFEIFDYRGAPDYYSVLGVERSASTAEIRRAYRRMAYMYHPDKLQAAGIDMSMHEIHVMMRELNEAKSTLLDPYKKQAYDISLLDSEL